QGSDQTRHAMIRDFQRDPVSRRPVHLDFVRVRMDTKIRVKVPVEVVGIAKGVRVDGGILDFVTREIEIECLPTDIPEHLPVEVSELAIGDAIRLSEVRAPEGVEVVDDLEKVIVHVAHPAHEEVPVAPEAEIAAAEPAEPEVLRSARSSASVTRAPGTKGPDTTPGFGSSRGWRRRTASGSARAKAGPVWGAATFPEKASFSRFRRLS
ncbi:MAG: 50S ribosomal protein L25, partial [Acidobacteria bacterium]